MGGAGVCFSVDPPYLCDVAIDASPRGHSALLRSLYLYAGIDPLQAGAFTFRALNFLRSMLLNGLEVIESLVALLAFVFVHGHLISPLVASAIA
jgi:hypothetical protein